MEIFQQMKRLFKGKIKLVLLLIVSSIILGFDGVVYPFFLGWFTDTLTEQNFGTIWMIVVLWLISLLAITSGNLLFNFTLGKIRQVSKIELKDKVVHDAYLKENEDRQFSYFLNTIMQDINQIESKYIESILYYIFCLSQGLIALALVLYTQWQLGLIFILLGFIPSLVPKILEKWLKKGTVEWQESNQQYTSFLKDSLQARRLVRRYQAKIPVFKKLESKLEDQEAKYFTMNFRQNLSNFGVNVLYYSVTIIGLSLGVYMVMQNTLTVGKLLTIYMAADRVTSPLVSLFTYHSWIMGTVSLVDDILEPKTLEIKPIQHQYSETIEPLVTLGQVAIGYDKTLLKDINLEINDRDRILIQGSSGIGKSTLLKVIMGELNALEGQVLYRSQFKDNLQNYFSVVEQAPFVFNDTLEFNLSLGHPIDKDKMIKALQQVELGEFANETSLNLLLGENNRVLSGGELKRLEVARALIHQKEILIVDEALSGLDDKTAEHLMRIIMEYPGTVIDIEHHISQEISEQFNKKLLLHKAEC